MKTSLLNHLSTLLNVSADRLRADSAYGGDINQAFRLADGQQSWFVKVNHSSKLPMFEAEKRGLQQIALSNAIRVPVVIDAGLHDEHSYLLLEFIELHGQPDPRKLALALVFRPLKKRFPYSRFFI